LNLTNFTLFFCFIGSTGNEVGKVKYISYFQIFSGGQNGISKDLREMDEEQFKQMFELLREKTNDWNEIKPEILKENPQFLFCFRILLCLSQSDLAKLMKVDKQWIRHFEACRQGFKKSTNFQRCISVLNRLLVNNGISMERSLEFLIENQKARQKNLIKFPPREVKFKRIFEMTEDDFVQQFEFLRKKTKDFTEFDPNILVINPELFATFRVITNMSIPEFSKKIEKDSWRIRRWESFKERMMPDSAIGVMKRIEKVFVDNKLLGNVSLETALENFSRFSFFEPDELEIKKILERESIGFEIHSDILGKKRLLNVDFSIPSS